MTDQTSDARGDVIVIGGGLAGLTAACFAARTGARVRLLERSRTLGGRARTQTRRDGALNLGPHALYRGGEAYDGLVELDVTPRGGPPPSFGFAYRQAGARLHKLPMGLWSGLLSRALDLGGKRELGALAGELARGMPLAAHDESFEQWLARRCRHESARAVLRMLARVSSYAADLDRIGADVVLLQLARGASSGVLYVDGGWQTLVDGLAARARELGVSIEHDMAVERVEATAATLRLQLQTGAVAAADAVVLALAPRVAAKLLGAAPRSWRPSAPVRAACLDLVLDALPRPRRRLALGLDEPLYFSVHSRARVGRRSVGAALGQGVVVHVARYLRARDDRPSAEVRAQLEQLVDVMQPGWRALVRHARFSPSLSVARRLPLAEHGGLAGRPDVDESGTPGVFIAGDWVGPRGWLADGAVASAREAALRVERWLAARRLREAA